MNGAFLYTLDIVTDAVRRGAVVVVVVVRGV